MRMDEAPKGPHSPLVTALITSGHTRAGLAAVRSLGRAGIAAAVGAPMRPALATWSRYATATLLLPDAEKRARSFAECVAEEAAGRNAVLVLAATDAEIWALSRWRENLPETARRVLPPHDAVARTLDRATLHDLARTLGISCLETLRVSEPRGVEPALREARRMGLPALVRPLLPWEEREDGTRRETERIRVSTLAELRRLLYERQDLVQGGCLIEPRPKGRFLSYCTVCEEGVPLVELYRERLREHALLSGIATLSRTMGENPALRDMSRRLLRALSWRGPAMVEYLQLPSGELKLVNVIGRVWGSVQLAIDAGIDVPLLCYRMAEGSPLPPMPHVARAGVSLRWTVGDMQQMVGRVLGQGGGGLFARARALVEFASPRALVGVHGDVYDRHDPMPFVFEAQAAAKGVRRASE
jgi:predicted ATP-grasp superfamily ATP-dependent carboligase